MSRKFLEVKEKGTGWFGGWIVIAGFAANGIRLHSVVNMEHLGFLGIQVGTMKVRRAEGGRILRPLALVYTKTIQGFGSRKYLLF